MQDEETDTWTDYDEEDIEDDEDDEELEEEEKDKFEAVEEQKDLEAESEIINGIDIWANFMPDFEARKMKELAAKAEKEKIQLRQLIRVT